MSLSIPATVTLLLAQRIIFHRLHPPPRVTKLLAQFDDRGCILTLLLDWDGKRFLNRQKERATNCHEKRNKAARDLADLGGS
jgi:hypothetical protein